MGNGFLTKGTFWQIILSGGCHYGEWFYGKYCTIIAATHLRPEICVKSLHFKKSLRIKYKHTKNPKYVRKNIF